MSFEVNHNEASQNSGGIIPEGEYEVIIKSALEDASKGGTMFINVPLIIRNDIDQPYKNAYIWHKIWQLKEPKDADRACGGYSAKGIQTLSKSAGLINGKKYADLLAWCDDLKNKLIRVTIKHEEYNNETQAKVRYINESKYKECKHVFKSNQKSTQSNQKSEQNESSGFYEMNEDEEDLPF